MFLGTAMETPESALLAQARRENEELRAEIARLKNGGAIGHSRVTDGQEAEAHDPAPHSYGNPGITLLPKLMEPSVTPE